MSTAIDTTRSWATAFEVSNQVKPSFLLRAATDSTYIYNQQVQLPGYISTTNAKAMMTALVQGTNIPVTKWSTTESLDQTTQSASFTTINALPKSVITSALATALPAEYFNPTPNTVFVKNSLGIIEDLSQTEGATQLIPKGFDLTAIHTSTVDALKIPDTTAGYSYTYKEQDVIYRVMQDRVFSMQAGNGANFPNPCVPTSESDATITAELTGTYSAGTTTLVTTLRNGSVKAGQFISGPGISTGTTILSILTSGATKTLTLSAPTLSAATSAIIRTGFWPTSDSGVGSYFVLIDDEVIRVTNKNGDSFHIASGGRAINGVLQAHAPGASITLLGFAPFSGDWTAAGYLKVDPTNPQISMLSPGNSFASYEGYGAVTQDLHKRPWSTDNPDQNMVFTGYWFTAGQSASFGTDGQMLVDTQLRSAGYALTQQKISHDVVIRLKNQFGSWAKASFEKAESLRNIPGDWADFTAWDPSRPGAYPLQIKTEFAQHKAFFDHMSQVLANPGQCEFCEAEWQAYAKQNKLRSNALAEARAIGKHIYQESIRVYNQGSGSLDPGPINTYLRLMTALAMAAWENPSEASPLAQRWTKIPQALWKNMLNAKTGRVFNSQLGVDLDKNQKQALGYSNYDWANQTTSDKYITETKKSLVCPFESTYDMQGWDQPARDLADCNSMVFSITRDGFPVLMPKSHKLRGVSSGYYDAVAAKQLATPVISGDSPSVTFNMGSSRLATPNPGAIGNWYLSSQGAVSSFQQQLDVDSLLTLVYVKGTTAFESEFTIAAAGTSIEKTIDAQGYPRIVWYSNKEGNKDALKLTNGAQQVDTVSLDHLRLGLSWDTQPANWGINLTRDGKFKQVDKKPTVPRLFLTRSMDKYSAVVHKERIKEVQKFINFMRIRAYLPSFKNPRTSKYVVLLNEDGVFGAATEAGVKEVRKYMCTTNNAAGQPFIPKAFTNNTAAGHWNEELWNACLSWLTVFGEYIKTDVWWYVQAGYSWDYYVAQITGLPIKQNKDKNATGKDSLYLIDQTALKRSIENWMTQFYQQAVAVGNKVVDEALAKSLTYNINAALADPRIELGDIIWLEIPGHMSATNAVGRPVPPYTNGMYVSSINRTLDLTDGTYTATYTGYQYRGITSVADLSTDYYYGLTKKN